MSIRTSLNLRKYKEFREKGLSGKEAENTMAEGTSPYGEDKSFCPKREYIFVPCDKRKYFYFTMLVVTRKDVQEYMKHHSEYTKANRFKDVICKIYI